MEVKKQKKEMKTEAVLLVVIFILSFLIADKILLIHTISENSSYIYIGQNSTSADFSSINTSSPFIRSAGISSTSSLITTNEYVNSTSNSKYNSNIFYNEKFYPGNVSYSSSSYSCTAISEITAPHLCLSLFTLFSCGGGPETANFNNVVGYIGYPQEDFKFPGADYSNYSNLYSATSNSSSQNIYQLQSNGFKYQNFINWSSKSIHAYSSIYSKSGQQYLYAVNHSFTGNKSISGSIPESTLIIPAISCGSTFINNYITYPGFVGNIYNISTLSGFTPSVYLSSKDENSFGAYYSLGYLLSLGNLPWSGSFDSLLAYQVQSINPAFNYTMPTEDYAQFPKGNKGAMQYINVTGEFLTPLTMDYFVGGNSSKVSIYVSNTAISSIAAVSTSSEVCSRVGPHGACIGYTQAVSTADSADTFTDPDLEAVYYPNYDNGVYESFRTDGIFPICAWNSSSNNILTSCTLENHSTVNNITYQRLWLSNNIKNNELYNATFSPGYSSSSEQNNFTLTALDSFCFYGESFNTADGVYTSPSYSRIIPPTTAENYTSAIGECNAFFNNTNCFSPSSSQSLNFEDGIFARGIACTSSGIHANNVTDAWISSVFVANNAGDYCGSFQGQKNPSDPLANSTMFFNNITTNCPEFNSNTSSVNLVITVKNVGNAIINNPYLIALYGNNNLSNIFYNSQNSISQTYSLYEDFLSQMKTTTGVIEVNYNNNFDTNMYVFDSGHPLNPIPLESLFSSGDGYINGPFNNSLLGMFIYKPINGLSNNVIRTSNIVLSQSSSGSSQVPAIQPNGTATFTIQVPMALFEALVSGKYNLSVFFGNTFNTTWNNQSFPSNSLLNGVTSVNPLVSSSNTNASQTHNNEIFSSTSGSPSPIWQYIVSYNFNMSKSPMKGVGIYSDNLSLSISPTNSTSNALNVTVNPSVSVFNGSGTYQLNLNQLKGSSISCFVSPDNVQDFGVFWSKQIVSPSNLNYALSNSIYSGEQKQASQVLINGWTGIIFMPYSDQVALNYNNLPVYSPSLTSFQLETPTLNTTANEFLYNVFDYVGKGSESSIFSNFSSLYNTLNSTVSGVQATIPKSSLLFNLVANSIVSDPSILRIVAQDVFENSSGFTNKSFSFSVVRSGITQCSIKNVTNINSTYSYAYSGCLADAVVNNSYLNISSNKGPFIVNIYNNSNLNISNESADDTVLMGANETLSKSRNGLFYITIPVNTSISNGVTLSFSPVPLTKQLYNSDLYLYNLNGTPFNCNIINNYNNTGDLGVSKKGTGLYYLPNGTIMCNLTSDFTYIRAVFINNSNNVYLGSGDIQSGLAISNISTSVPGALNISINGIPVNAQNANIDSGLSNNACTTTSSENIYNGILRYNKGCTNLSYSLITFDYNENGTDLLESAVISPKNYNKTSPSLMYSSPSVATTSPIGEYNISVANTGAVKVPIQFDLSNNFGGCNNMILTSQSPYPYAEIPYQLVSTSSNYCNYVFIGSSGNTYSALEISSPSIIYPNNWLSYNSSQYNVQFSYSNLSGDLVSNCQSGFGPCIDSFSSSGNTLGNLLFNNVSTSSATISQTLQGPIEDCFTVQYSSSQTVNIPENGFGSVNYENNKIYQTITPSQSINSEYCFYRGSKVITDNIQASGSPITFKVQNQMISNFSYVKDSNGSVFYVPPSIDVGYSGYNSVTVSKSVPVYYNITGVNLLQSCLNYTLIGGNASTLSTSQVKGSNITSSNIETPEKLYCIDGSMPSFTPQLSLSALNNSNRSKGKSLGLGFAYQPGNYTNGVGTIYDSCIKPTSLITLNDPEFYINGTKSTYDGSSSENNLISNSANSSGLEMLYSPSGSVFIDSCAPNETVLSYSACTEPVNTVPENGSYNSLEALPSNGDLYGGGCFIGDLKGTNYACAPTDGALNYHVSSKSDKSSKVSVSTIVLNQTNAPTTAFSVSFDCSVSASNSTKLLSTSCNYPNNANSGICSASVSYKQVNSTAYNITAECSLVSTSTFKITTVSQNKISNLNINSSQSEKTGLVNPSLFECGNETNTINSNVINGWNWKPYSTAGTVNPVTTTNPAGIAEVGGCEAGRDSFSVENPNITLKTDASTKTFQYTYSCSSGYSGTIVSCSGKTSLPSSIFNNPTSNSCYSKNITLINNSLDKVTVNGNNNGGTAIACNPFSKSGYLSPTVQDNCIAYHSPAKASTNSNYALQYSNSSNYGVGMGVLGGSYKLNISIPNSKQQNSVKDAYFTSLSESQIEGANNIFTNLLPSSFLESNLPSKALSISAAYSFDMLNILMLQNPSFGVSGIPGFVNGSILDYALSIFTGGTSGNCAPPYNESGDAIFTLGEGELCSGKTLPSSYKEGVFLSLGTLNEGLHSIQFYSVGNSTNEAQPSVTVFDSVGNAADLNTACSNGDQKVFTSTYKGGKWSFNITSDQQCDTVNNKLYGYIVNCLYQTPGNQTYTIASQYYLAYNLPTVWNISYSLLVAPKSYQVVPTPVYQINASTGSVLTLQQPNKTTFIERGLPNGYKWNMEFNGINLSSKTDVIYFYSTGSHSFKVSTLYNYSTYPDCYTKYTPSPNSGKEITGTTTYIQFLASTTCYTYFKESGLPSGQNWWVNYNGVNESASSSSNIEFTSTTNVAYIQRYSYNIGSIKTKAAACTDTYVPDPSSGDLIEGENQSVVYSLESDTCITTFKESGLPSGYNWEVTYNGTSKTSSLSTIEFNTGPGSLSYSISAPSNSSNGCTETYPISPSSSGSLPAGESLTVTFSPSSSCITTFKESGLPSGYTWSVTYAGQSGSARTGSPISITSKAGSFTASASISGLSCSASAKVDTGGSYTFSSWSCTTTFYQSGGSNLNWEVSYDGKTNYGSTTSPISITTNSGSYTATASIPGYDCSTNSISSTTGIAGGSYTFNPWSCTTNFYIWTQSPEPSGNNNENENVIYNGISKTKNWAPSKRVTLPNGQSGLKLTYTGLSNPGISLSWSVNSPIDGGDGSCDYGAKYDVWTADSPSGSISPGQNVYVYYTLSCNWDRL